MTASGGDPFLGISVGYPTEGSPGKIVTQLRILAQLDSLQRIAGHAFCRETLI